MNEATGDMLAPYEVFKQIAGYWDEMNQLEKENLAITLGGKNQLEVLTSLVSNFGAAEKALGLAIEDQNSAWKENQRYLESIEAKANNVKAAWSEIVLGDGGISDFIKTILDATTNLLKFLQTDFGGFITKVGLATLAVVALNVELKKTTTLSLGQWLTTIGENFVMLTKFIAQLVVEYTSIAVATNVATAATTAFNGALMLIEAHPIVAMLTAVTAGVILVTKHINEQKEALSELNIEVGNLKDEISSLENEKKNLESLKELNEQQERRVQLLQAEIDAKKELLKTQYKSDSKLREERESSNTHGVKNFWQGNRTDDYLGISSKAALNLDTEDETTSINDLITAYNTLMNTKAETLEQDNEIESQKAAIIERLSEEGLALYDVSEKVGGLSDSDQSLLDKIEEVIGKISEENDATDETVANLDELAEEYGVSSEAIQSYIDAHPELIENLGSEAEAAEYAAQQLSANSESLTELVGKLSDVQSAYSTLVTAEEEFNAMGTVSAKTLKSLLELGSEYQACLELNNGVLTVNKDKFEELRVAQIRDAEAEAILVAENELAKIANENLAGSLELASNTAKNKKPAIEQIGQAALQSGIDAANGAIGWDDFWDSVDNENGKFDYSKFSKEQKKQADEVKKNLENTITFLETQITKGSDYVSKANESAAKSASGSHKSAAKESKDAWLEAYKAEKDTIDSMYKTSVLSAEEYAAKLQELSDKYLTDSKEHQEKYAKEIHSIYEEMYKALQKSLKEALDEEEKSLKKSLDDIKDQKSERVKAVKRENEEVLKGIKKQIDALKDEKKTIKDSYDARIDALKAERKEYERQIELMKLKQELAKAEHTFNYVMDASGHFQWLQDQEAVDKAREDELEEQKKQQYERELEDLEKARDDAVALYEKRIDDLEKYYDAEKERRDKALDDLEDYYDKEIKTREDAYNTFKEQADAWLNGQYEVAAQENTVYGQRLANLKSFVDNYNTMLAQLGKEGQTASNNYKGTTGSKPNGVSGSSDAKKNTVNNAVKSTKKAYVPTSVPVAKSGVISLKKRASGDAYTEDGAYIVGENPNQEIVLGSKLNNGVMMNLSKGSGVVNAKSTRTLAGLLNSLNPNGLGKVFNPNTTNNNTSNSITISNVSLPNVKDGADFISYLQNFDVDMLQRAY